jgi:hypothetical protein
MRMPNSPTLFFFPRENPLFFLLLLQRVFLQVGDAEDGPRRRLPAGHSSHQGARDSNINLKSSFAWTKEEQSHVDLDLKRAFSVFQDAQIVELGIQSRDQQKVIDLQESQLEKQKEEIKTYQTMMEVKDQQLQNVINKIVRKK